MPAIIPDFEYDIFISYRQNDNKYDGWVTEFVNNLNKELEATLKDKVTVYFDANAHDGLLETHSVDRSLESKLKCLIFVPILSKTYCDSKSFAWNHEFLPFIEQAGKDQFGFNVKLNSGNVASRVLPVRIHDLDAEDTQLAESLLGVIRAVDFIYHSPGVNRSLRPWDDDVIKNTKQLFYRDQINKVANAVDEILRGLKQAAKVSAGEKIALPAADSKINVESDQQYVQKEGSRKISLPFPKAVRWRVIAVLGAFALFYVTQWYVRQKNISRAHMVLLPAIQKLADENFPPTTQAFDMAMEAKAVVPDDSALIKLLSRLSATLPIETNPPGAEVYWKDYTKPDGEWRLAGVTPIKESRFPRTYMRMQIMKPGYQTIEYAGSTVPFPYSSLFITDALSHLQLDKEGSLPPNMVRIPKKTATMDIIGLEQERGKKVGEFLIDRYEVTNKEYKAFMDAGGYGNKTYWKYPIYFNEKEIALPVAIAQFIDRTARQGPANWEAGTYPDGEENHPVTGVSWYEAAAYAAFAHKQLPTVFHWSVVAETSRTEFIVPLSNYKGHSTPVGSMKGYSTFGIYDLAGNAREWCFNESNNPGERFFMGGGWNDATYSFNQAYTQPALDRNLSNGFRCIRALPGDSTLTSLTRVVKMEFRDYRKEKPVDDKTFTIFIRQYAYDKGPLNAKVVAAFSNESWTAEKISFDAGYNNERAEAYLYLPKGFKAPFQTVLFFPGGSDVRSTRYDPESIGPIDFILKSGRAVMRPIYKGTHERHDGLKFPRQDETVFYRDHVIMWRKDIGRSIDYLETRTDIRAGQVAFLGWSWGAFMGGIMPALENRIKVVVLYGGGMTMLKALPEVDQINFIPRVVQPVLMLNGKHDMFFPVETGQKPMFDLLGAPNKDKKMFIYESGHLMPKNEFVKESLLWLDHYLGPVK